MHRVLEVDLDGRSQPYRMHEDAYEALGRYLDDARSRLTDDLDQDEVMGDLERGIGAKLTERLGSVDRIVTLEDVTVVVQEVGPVASDDVRPATAPQGSTPRRRRLSRIRDGQWIAGVCTGVAAYSEIRVDWVRTIFILLTIFTGGVFGLVYLVMAFVLPVTPTYESWIGANTSEDRSA